MENTIAFIPLRAGSKGLPGKNTKVLNGKPLYQHTMEAALSTEVKEIYISTDINEILHADLPPRIKIVERPNYLATSEASMEEVLMDFLVNSLCSRKNVLLLQATSPLRCANHIREAHKLFSDLKYDLVMSVTEMDQALLKSGHVENSYFIPITRAEYLFANRQSLPQIYKPNGAIYVFNSQWFERNGGFSTERLGAYIMDKEFSWDIDDDNDFQKCSEILKNTET